MDVFGFWLSSAFIIDLWFCLLATVGSCAATLPRNDFHTAVCITASLHLPRCVLCAHTRPRVPCPCDRTHARSPAPADRCYPPLSSLVAIAPPRYHRAASTTTHQIVSQAHAHARAHRDSLNARAPPSARHTCARKRNGRAHISHLLLSQISTSGSSGTFECTARAPGA